MKHIAIVTSTPRRFIDLVYLVALGQAAQNEANINFTAKFTKAIVEASDDFTYYGIFPKSPNITVLPALKLDGYVFDLQAEDLDYIAIKTLEDMIVQRMEREPRKFEKLLICS